MIEEVREISRRQFDAFCYARAPFLKTFSEEVAWFEGFGRKVLGVVVTDFYDKDYGFVILGRDARNIFRAIKLPGDFYENPEEAKDALVLAMEEFRSDGQTNYPQGDEKKLPHEIFKLQVKGEKIHRYFRLLISEPHYEGAVNIIKEIAYSYVDVDGNYIKDFQSTGFDSRLWELFLYMYLHSSGFSINNDFHAPDYVVDYFGIPFSIEAVTVNSSPTFDEPNPKNAREAHLLRLDYMPIKFGSPLTTKLKKRYWDERHVKGKPLILAIHDYHQPANLETAGSMTWSRFALMDYLYGIRPKFREEGDIFVAEHTRSEIGVHAILEKVEFHSWKGKKIPSNFFGLETAENISAVLFSNTATITTFNRMGKLAGLGSANVKMIRSGFKFDPTPFALEPQQFIIDVDSPEYEESWSDGLVMYHNPNTLYPVDINAFANVSHVFFDQDRMAFSEIINPHNVFASTTLVFKTKE